MTEDSTASTEPPTRPTFDELVTPADASPADFFLDFVSRGLLGDQPTPEGAPVPSFGITISCGGIVVSGQAITQTEWTRLLAAEIGGASQSLAENFAEGFKFLEDAISARRAEREAQGLAIAARAFIHLKDATVCNADPVLHVGLWRARLAQLDGWTLGVLDSAR